MNYSDYAKLYLGVKQGSNKHKQIIDSYNTIKPLPRGYKVTYSDAWCATFVSFVLYHCNAINPPYECSVYEMYEKCLANKQLITAKLVDINDIVFYDWNNNGSLDHVGIISAINGDVLTVIEGNKSKSVGYRTINKYNNEVAYFARIKQGTATITEQLINNVIRGDFGNGEERIKKLTSAGYNYEEVQKLVNIKLRGY